MAVTGLVFSINYVTNGATTDFPYPYYLFQFSDLVAIFTPTGGNSVLLVLNSDYNLSGTEDTFGAYPSGVNLDTIGSLSPLAAGVLYITRFTKRTQEISFIDNSPFPADQQNHANDKLTLMEQERGNLSAISAAIGGAALTLGQVVTTTLTIAGAIPGQVVVATPSKYPGDGFEWRAYVSALNTVVLVLVCRVAGTPVSSTYNVRVIQ